MVNIYKLEFTILQQEILRFLFVNAGVSFNARRIANSLGVSSTAILKALPKLEKKNLINVQKDKESKRLSIKLKDNKDVIFLKRVENLKLLYKSGIVEFLSEKFPGSTIVLFGSYSFGEDTVHSDIDIAVVGVKEKDVDLGRFSRMLGGEIMLHFYTDLKSVDNNLRENVLNGIILKGGVEL